VLTKKELLNYKKYKGNIKPIFINIHDEELNLFCQNIIEIYNNSIGNSKIVLEEEVKSISSVIDIDIKIKNGLIKLLNDRLEFDSNENSDISDFRNFIFKESNLYFQSDKSLNLEDYKTEISNLSQISFQKIQDKIYSDLPNYNKVFKFKEISAIDLLRKYNISLVQGLLFHTEKIKIKIQIKDVLKSDLRYILRKLKFFQLENKITKNNDNLIFDIDGPLSLFIQNQKYGFNLASFFPSITFLKNWGIEAEVFLGKTEKQKGILILDNKNFMTKYDLHYSSYIPEELEIFEKLFEEKSLDWRIIKEYDDFLFDGNEYFFPDYKIVNSNKSIYLEVFHKWHKSSLIRRLKNIEENNDINLIVAVSRNLLKDIEINKAITNSNNFKHHGLLFREMPTVSQVLEKLSSFN
jgi:predicted nuclease of restriction endonuclease-like RecB superfamily